MAEIDAAPESPPSCPSDNGDRLDREPLRLVEKAEGESTPQGKPAKRKMSEKQLETLRKAREAKAAKARGLHPPPTPQSQEVIKDDGAPASEPELEVVVTKPKPKSKTVAKAKPKVKPTLIEVRTYHEEPTPKTEMFNVF